MYHLPNFLNSENSKVMLVTPLRLLSVSTYWEFGVFGSPWIPETGSTPSATCVSWHITLCDKKTKRSRRAIARASCGQRRPLCAGCPGESPTCRTTVVASDTPGRISTVRGADNDFTHIPLTRPGLLSRLWLWGGRPSRTEAIPTSPTKSQDFS